MNMMQQTPNGKIRCKKCGSTLVYIRLNKDERVCRNCGHIEKIK